MALTKATYSMISGAVVNALDHGASTTSSDNSAAINAAIVKAGAGGAVYLPSGIYEHKSSITLPYSNFTFFGDGRNSSVLKYTGTAGGTSVLVTAVGAQQKNVYVHDIGINGNALASKGLWIKTGTGGGTHIESFFEKIQIQGTTDVALWLGAASLADSAATQLSECIFADFFITGCTGTTSVRIRGNFAGQVCAFNGFQIDQSGPNYGFHLEESPGPFYINQSTLGAVTSAIYCEVTFSAFNLSCVQCYMSEGAATYNFFKYGASATQSGVLSFVDCNMSVPTTYCWDFRGPATYASFMSSIMIGASPAVIYGSNGGSLFTSGCLVGNPYTTFFLTPLTKVLSQDFGANGQDLTYISKRLSVNTNSGTTALTVGGSAQGISVYTPGTVVATPANPTVTAVGTAGSAIWGYKISAYTATGETIATTEIQVANGNATLNSSNYNRLSWDFTPNADGYKIYRTTSGGTPATLGYIGSVTTFGITTFDDTGLFGDSTSAPTVNTTAVSQFLGGLKVDVIATASLPAAGTVQNGRVLIEDAGAGDRNLILYAGGQRFRIDGGAPF
jgi:hypothetical protein